MSGCRSGHANLGAVALAAAIMSGPSTTAIQAQDLPAGENADLVRSRCLVCHGVDMISQQRLSRDAWTRELDKMIGWGARLNGDEKERTIAYLSELFADPMRQGPNTSDARGASLVDARCHVCHDNQLIEQQRLTEAGWSREVEKMIGWGARVDAGERSVLVEHLTSLHH